MRIYQALLTATLAFSICGAASATWQYHSQPQEQQTLVGTVYGKGEVAVIAEVNTITWSGLANQCMAK